MRSSVSKAIVKSACASAIVATALSIGLAGCGSNDPLPSTTGDGGATRVAGPLLPWKVGNSWTYRVTDGADVTTKVTTIGAAEVVGGTGPNAAKMANKVITAKGANDQTISWQTQGEDGLTLRYREQSFSDTTGALELEEHWDPYKVHFDDTAEHTAPAASWLVEYKETKLPVNGDADTSDARDRWTVVAEAESITVPAGTFNAVVVQKSGGSALKTYWYVPNIGKVKETGGQTEELMSFAVAP